MQRSVAHVDGSWELNSCAMDINTQKRATALARSAFQTDSFSRDLKTKKSTVSGCASEPQECERNIPEGVFTSDVKRARTRRGSSLA